MSDENNGCCKEPVSVNAVAEEIVVNDAAIPHNEEVTQEAPKPKQYMIVVDQNTMPFLAKVIPGLMYVEVEGWTAENNKDHMFLVNPLPKE